MTNATETTFLQDLPYWFFLPAMGTAILLGSGGASFVFATVAALAIGIVFLWYRRSGA